MTILGRHLTNNQWLYALTWTIGVALFVVAWLLLDSRFGRSLRAVRDSELAAAASGVNRSTYKVAAFGVSAAFAGVGGSLLAINVAYVSPDTFPIQLSLYLLVGAVVGFYGSIWGAVLGALLIQFLPDLVHQVPHIDDKQAGPTTFFFGAVLIVLMLLLPLLLRVASTAYKSGLLSGAMTRNLIASAAALVALALAGIAGASTTATPGVSSSKVTIGSSGPLSGEAAAAAGVLRGADAYFKYVNARGGVNGRKIDFKYLDDAYDPSQTVENVRAVDPAGQRVRTLLGRRHERQPRDPRLRERGGRAAGVLRHRRDDLRPRLREAPVDDRLPAAVLGGGPDLRAPHPGDEWEEGEDRRPLPERRLRQGPAERVPQGARSEEEPDRADRRLRPDDIRRAVAGCAAEGERREHVLHLRVRQVRDPVVRLREQARVEAAHLRQRRRVGFVDHEAEPAGHGRGHDLDRSGGRIRRRRSSRSDPGVKLAAKIIKKYVPGGNPSDGFLVAGMAEGFSFVDALKKAGKNLTRKGLMTAVTHMNEANNPFLIPG